MLDGCVCVWATLISILHACCYVSPTLTRLPLCRLLLFRSYTPVAMRRLLLHACLSVGYSILHACTLGYMPVLDVTRLLLCVAYSYTPVSLGEEEGGG